MHPLTSRLAQQVRKVGNLPGQLELLHDAYTGADCVIVTCGPSLVDAPPERLRSALEGKLTLAVKQACRTTGDQTDFLCFNSFNVTRYPVASKDTLRLLMREPSGEIPQLNWSDITMRQSKDAGELSLSLAATEAFASHPLDGRSPRPWGPGIMYEVVLHLAVHLGVRRITTLGWDIANTQGKNTHYYDQAHNDTFFERDRGSSHALASTRGRLPSPVRKTLRWGRALAAHASGQLYNRALPVHGETELVGRSTSGANCWLLANAITLEVITGSEHLDPSIQRRTLTDFFEEAGV